MDWRLFGVVGSVFVGGSLAAYCGPAEFNVDPTAYLILKDKEGGI